MRLSFGTYAPRYDLLVLWGTVDEYNADTEEEFDRAYNEARKILVDDNGYLIAQWWIPV